MTQNRSAKVIYLVENTMAALVFMTLLSANSLAYLLYNYPGSELLWRLSIPVGRAAAPVSLALENAFRHYALTVSICLLAGCILLPVYSYIRRSWLGTAVSGHIALAGIALMIANFADNELKITLTASNHWIINTDLLNGRIVMAGVVFAVMLVLCILNHIMFFKRIKTASVIHEQRC